MKMTKEQAVQILDQAISQIQTSRQGHETLIQALRVLMEKNEEEE